MRNTKISWTDDTWNVTEGCSRTIAKDADQSGCGDPSGGGCYAEAMAYRFSGPGQWAEGLVRMTPNGPRWTGVVRLRPDRLDAPLRIRDQRLIFVCSTSDPFHERLNNEEIAAIYGAMAAAPRQTFQMLTKRARRRREWFAWVEREAASCNDGNGMSPAAYCFAMAQRCSDSRLLRRGDVVDAALRASWPLPNVWEGASVENMAAARERIPDLLATPAMLRFLSCEPLLEQVDLAAASPNGRSYVEDLDWVIAGCESGHQARPAHVDWYRLLRDQCAAADARFFLKQAEHTPGDFVAPATLAVGFDVPLSRVKKRRSEKAHQAGRGDLIELPHLDGRVHADIPGRHVICATGPMTSKPMTWG